MCGGFFEDAVGGFTDALKDVGSSFDDVVNKVPGGWATVGAVAAGGLPGFGAEGVATGGLGDLAAMDAVYGGASIPAWEASLANLAGAGGLGDLTGVDWTDPANWDKAGLGDVGMGGAAPTSFLSDVLKGAKNFLGKDIGIGGLTGGGALVGAAGLYKLIDMMKEDNKRFGTPGRQDYTGGALSKFKYDPGSFTPTRADPSKFRPTTIRTLNQDLLGPIPPMSTPTPVVAPKTLAPTPVKDIKQTIDALDLDEKSKDIQKQIRRALGGFGFAEGGKTQRPQRSSKAKLAALDPYNRAIAELNNAAYDARMPQGAQAPAANISQMGQFASGGGISDLGGYSDGGRLLRGPGDGVSDSIPAVIGGKQPARLADGEFVVPARIVSELGNGSTDAGARKLYAMMDRIQKARGATTGKGKVAKNTRADKHLPA